MFRNKAIADGAVSFCIDHCVTARVSKFAFGTRCNVLYDSNDPEHSSQSHMRYVSPVSGKVSTKGLFSNILPMVVLLFVLYFHAKSEWSRGCTVNETQEFDNHSPRMCPLFRHLSLSPLASYVIAERRS